MGDVGDALSGLAGGIGSALSGVGSAFSGGGGDMGSALSSMMSGSAAPGQASDPAQSFQQTVDPTGSVAASEAINPPGAAPTSANQQGQGQNQAQAPPKPAAQQTPPQSAIDQLRKLLQQKQQPNPYQTGGGQGGGGGGGGGGAGGGQGGEGDWLGKYTRGQGIQPSPWQDPQGTGGAPSSPLEGGSATDEPPSDQPTDIPRVPGLSSNAGAPDIGSARNPRAAAAGQGAVGAATAPQDAAPPAPQIGPGSAAAAGGVPPIVSSLARASPLGVAGAVMQPTPAETGELPPTAANIPPDQRNMPYPGQQYSPDPSLPTGQPTPAGTTSGGPGGGTPTAPAVGNRGQMPPPPQGQGADDATKPPTKGQYEDWLKKQGVSPSDAKKQADASTPDQRNAAKPTGERPYHMDGDGRRGVSNISRDRAGMQGVPQMLGELAQAVMPLLGGLMGGGGMFGGRGRFHGRGFPWGRGGHGRFGGRYMGGHPGGHGSGMYPYHHPGMGWSGFNHHPGGGWRPLDPRYAASMGGQVGGGAAQAYGDGDGGGDMSQLAPILQALGINVPGGQGGQGGGFRQGGRFGGGGGQGGGGGASGGYAGPPSTTPGRGPNGQPLPYTGQQADQFTRQVAQSLGIDPNQASRVLQAESAYGQNYSNNRDPGAGSHGPFQLDIAPGALGQAFMQATGEDPRDPSTWKDQIVYALRYAQTRGWGPWTTAQRMGFGRQPAGRAGAQFAWNYGQGGGAAPGTTATGGNMAPNPNGNIVQKNFDNSPITSADAPITQAASQ